MMVVTTEALLSGWEFREPSMSALLKTLDRVARVAIREGTPEAATAKLRALLHGVRGHLPSWMTSDFWTIEFNQLNLAAPNSMKIDGTSYVMLPTSLSGARVEFYPISKNSVKAVLPHRDLFVVGDSMLEAMIGLGRLAGGPRGPS